MIGITDRVSTVQFIVQVYVQHNKRMYNTNYTCK